MKRSAALAPLSRDHHHALDAARRLRRALPHTADDAVAHFLAFWAADGRRHLAIEEDLLFDVLPPGDAEWAAAVARITADHAAIREAATALAGAPTALDAVRELGGRLQDHVRFEERTAFPLLEERLPADSLDDLGRRVAAAERDTAPGAG